MNYLEDFPMLKKGIVYFDNAATTYKPKSVINSLIDYNINFTANSHRGDYNNSFKVDDEIDKTREKVRQRWWSITFKSRTCIKHSSLDYVIT